VRAQAQRHEHEIVAPFHLGRNDDAPHVFRLPQCRRQRARVLQLDVAPSVVNEREGRFRRPAELETFVERHA
jgi:hypothetical protein